MSLPMVSSENIIIFLRGGDSLGGGVGWGVVPHSPNAPAVNKANSIVEYSFESDFWGVPIFSATSLPLPHPPPKKTCTCRKPCNPHGVDTDLWCELLITGPASLSYWYPTTD